MRALVINCSPVREGATAYVAGIISESLSGRCEVRSVCIDDYRIGFCRGCRTCHATGKCVQRDDADALTEEFGRADIIVAVSPSYWADVPGQFKTFIDRCTPWSNTHEPHGRLAPGKRGYAAVLRTGPGMKECERIVWTLTHFFGHLEIEMCGSLALCSVENKKAAEARKDEILAFCETI